MTDEYNPDINGDYEGLSFELRVLPPDVAEKEPPNLGIDVVEAELIEEGAADASYNERVRFMACHRSSGTVLIGTAATLEDAIRIEQESRHVVEEAGFELSLLPDGLATREIPYVLLVRFAYEICLRQRYGR